MAGFDFQKVPLFSYEPLTDPTSNIRLLRILPSADEQEAIVRCTLELGEVASEYVCLSYMWGTDTESHSLLVNGQAMLVRDNLWAFLLQAQKSWIRKLPIWIDAICINQKSKAEKGAQVALMGSIYENASEVVAWLGENDKAVENAFQFMKKWGHEELESLLPGTGSITANDAIINDNLPLQLYLDAFHVFGSLEYFSRLWTVQEILFAKKLTLRYGTGEMSSRCLENIRHFIEMSEGSDRAREILNQCHCSITFDERWYAHTRKSRRRYQPADFLFKLLVKFRKHNCSETLDRIYALRALDRTGTRIPVDYNTSRAQVFRHVFRNYKTNFPVGDGFHLIQALQLTIDDLSKQTVESRSHRIWSQEEPHGSVGRITIFNPCTLNGEQQSNWSVKGLQREEMQSTCGQSFVLLGPNSEHPELHNGDMFVLLTGISVCVILRHNSNKEVKQGTNEHQLLPCGSYSLITVLQIHTEDIQMTRAGSGSSQNPQRPKPIRLIPCAATLSWEDVRQTTAFIQEDFYHPDSSWLADGTSFIYLHLNWACLLSLWKLLEQNPSLFEDKIYN